MLRLIVSARGEEHEESYECNDETISIGRSSENSIVLSSSAVSRQHAQVLVHGNNAFLIDLGSGNGTELNGHLVKSNEKHLLKNGDIISLENYDIRFASSETGLFPNEEEITESDVLEVKLLKKVLAALDKETAPSFEVLNGIEEGKKVYLSDDVTELIIGRDPECSFPVREHVISRRHSKIMKKCGGITIRDLESKNGTFVNNRRIVEETLHDGDRIALGTIVFMFRNPQEVNLAQFERVKPKIKPAQVKPEDIPLAEENNEESKNDEAQDENISEEELTGNEQSEKPPAAEEWEQLKDSASAENYPPPIAASAKRLTSLELGMIGLGAIILIFALITLFNVLWA